MKYITASVNKYMLRIVTKKEKEMIDRQANILVRGWETFIRNNERISSIIDTGRRILTFGWMMEAGRQLINDDILVLIPIIPASKSGKIAYIIVAVLNMLKLMPRDFEWWRSNYCPFQGGEEDEENRNQDHQNQLQIKLGAANWITKFLPSNELNWSLEKMHEQKEKRALSQI